VTGPATASRGASVPWSRPEPFGAWVRLDDATLIAVDARFAERIGVPHGHAIGKAPRPLELHVAVTARCPAPCTGCYLDARPDGHEPPFEALVARLAEARAAGVSTVAFGGGEPLTRGDLGRLAEEARGLGLVPVMTTSGIGLTAARATELRAFAQINVSHDGTGGAYEAVRGFDAAAHAERAIALLAAAGIPVGVNVVLTRASFPHLDGTAARAADLGAGEIQLLRYKPAGRADEAGYEARRLSAEQGRALWPAVERLVASRRLRVRIDCAMVPLIADALLTAVPDAAKVLASLGVFGCEAGRHLGALTVAGQPAPCSFFSLPGREAGLVPLVPPVQVARASRDLPAAWDEGEELARFRAYHAAPPEPCRSCALFSVCRGGCQVVSRRAAGAFAPDPECPRVARAREA
jgi:radical SAM protein with 4Fe4S-binding SPASM domain